jgi:ppGpp synthetase/RelA/SpoT-type nucleotidyltranferase
MSYPSKFDKELYINWHKEHLEDINIINDIEKTQDEISDFFFDNDKKILLGLFQFINEVIRISKIRRQNINFEIVPEQPKNIVEFKRKYLKTTDSIINKLWRKNQQEPKIKMSNLKDYIKDLIRFSIKVDSLKSAETIANILSDKSILVDNSTDCKNLFESNLEKIAVDNEMKMSSGYFAYHCYFHFQNSCIVEIQLFSELSNYWRKMSHNIYEQVRISDNENMKFNDINSRVISIGHMLYLAECELYNIENELENK